MKTVAFFNNKGGVGKTSLVYHLAWMFEHLGVRAIAVDLDPQSNLTSVFLDEDRLEDVWPEGDHPLSILGALRPLVRGIGDVSTAHVEQITEWLGVIIGDLGLSQFEDRLSDAWPRCLDGQEPAFRASSAFYRVILQTAQQHDTDLVLLDVGPNLGALNRAALIAADYVVIPLAPDLFSLQGLRNLGPTLDRWRSEWAARLPKSPDPELRLPSGKMEPVGYVIMQHAIRGSRPTRAYDRWAVKIPAEYARAVNAPSPTEQPPADDGNRLALIKHFRSLMPMAQEARKPICDRQTEQSARTRRPCATPTPTSKRWRTSLPNGSASRCPSQRSPDSQHDIASVMCEPLQPWVHRFTFQCQHAEDTFVDAAQRLALCEALQRFNPEGEFTQGQ